MVWWPKLKMGGRMCGDDLGMKGVRPRLKNFFEKLVRAAMRELAREARLRSGQVLVRSGPGRGQVRSRSRSGQRQVQVHVRSGQRQVQVRSVPADAGCRRLDSRRAHNLAKLVAEP